MLRTRRDQYKKTKNEADTSPYLELFIKQILPPIVWFCWYLDPYLLQARFIFA